MERTITHRGLPAGLNPKLRLHLAAYDDTHGLERFIQLAIRCSHRMLSCSPDVSTAIAPPPNRQPEVHNPPEAMQTDSNRLTTSERQRRLTQHLCLYCGASGHMILACPLRPPRPLVSAIQPSIQRMNPLSTCAQLTVSKTVISVTALLDSGSAAISSPEVSAVASDSRPRPPKPCTKFNP